MFFFYLTALNHLNSLFKMLCINLKQLNLSYKTLAPCLFERPRLVKTTKILQKPTSKALNVLIGESGTKSSAGLTSDAVNC